MTLGSKIEMVSMSLPEALRQKAGPATPTLEGAGTAAQAPVSSGGGGAQAAAAGAGANPGTVGEQRGHAVQHTPAPSEGAQARTETARGPGGRPSKTRSITKEMLAACFNMTSEEACKKLGIGLTILKRHCRKFGISRWPYRKYKSLSRLIKHVSTCETSVPLLNVRVDDLKNQKELMEAGKCLHLSEETKKLQQAVSKASHKQRKAEQRDAAIAEASARRAHLGLGAPNLDELAMEDPELTEDDDGFGVNGGGGDSDGGDSDGEHTDTTEEDEDMAAEQPDDATGRKRERRPPQRYSATPDYPATKRHKAGAGAGGNGVGAIAMLAEAIDEIHHHGNGAKGGKPRLPPPPTPVAPSQPLDANLQAALDKALTHTRRTYEGRLHAWKIEWYELVETKMSTVTKILTERIDKLSDSLSKERKDRTVLEAKVQRLRAKLAEVTGEPEDSLDAEPTKDGDAGDAER